MLLKIQFFWNATPCTDVSSRKLWNHSPSVIASHPLSLWLQNIVLITSFTLEEHQTVFINGCSPQYRFIAASKNISESKQFQRFLFSDYVASWPAYDVTYFHAFWCILVYFSDIKRRFTFSLINSQITSASCSCDTAIGGLTCCDVVVG